MRQLSVAVAEAVGTFALCFIGMSAIALDHSGAASLGLVGIALAHGLAIAVMVTATAAISGGAINPAVTAGLLAAGEIDAKKASAHLVGQILGATVAGILIVRLHGIDLATAGVPALGAGVGVLRGIAVEAVLTFLLVFVVFGSAVHPKAPPVGGFAIGMTVAMDILAGGPLTGGAMNPARAFGPALATGAWANQAVYWIGPLAGGLTAGILYRAVFRPR